MHMKQSIVPSQHIGNQTGAKASVDTKDVVKAVNTFIQAKSRLLDINNWHKYSGTAATKFTLTDSAGNPVNRSPQKGDYIKIDVPGPGTIAGQGYDWVCIEQFEEKQDKQSDLDFFAFRVRPAANPTSGSATAPAHFYTKQTTSTFIVQREGTVVSACEKGRNEVPNTHTDKMVDNMRNGLVAVGATLGLSIPQWKVLMEGLLK